MSTPSKEAPHAKTTSVPGPRPGEEAMTGAPIATTGAAQSPTAMMGAAAPVTAMAGMTGAATAMTATVRIALSGVFLWAFLDKAFGLGYSTPAARAWINGGSPSGGFLGSIDQGPFAAMFRSWAGTWWADWGYMIGMLGVGLGLLLGIGLRITAVAGTAMMALLWMAEWPPAKFTNAGEPTGSTNPIIDYHVIYALVMIALAITLAGHRWGLGRQWSQLSIVQRYPWLR